MSLSPYGILWPGAHTPLMWRARVLPLPRVATAFSRVWAVAPEELMSSFEAFSPFAPPGEPERIAGWRPVEVGLVARA